MIGAPRRPSPPPTAVVRLRRGRARPFWHGNPIVYSGAVAGVHGEPPMSGDLVEVRDHADRAIGWGFFHATSQYRVRLVAWASEPDLRPDLASILEVRLARAAALRRLVGLPGPDTTAWRLLNSEGDGLSGLTVDVFGGAAGERDGPIVAVVMASAAWVERHRGLVEEAIRRVLPPGVRLVFRSSPVVGSEEGLAPAPAEADVPGPMEVLERGLRFVVSPGGSQKTGFYLDQRDNRALVRAMAAWPGEGRASGATRVLDAFCFTGGFALNAAVQGAAEVLAVDSSGAAVGVGRENARLNGLSDRVRFEEADALEVLEASPRAFDLVVCDPPPLARSARDIAPALARYRRVNRAALAAVSLGGMLVTCSCSSAVRRDLFLEVLRDAAAEANRRFTVTHVRGAAPDHPIHPAFPEGEYLTCVVGTVS